MSKKDLFFSFYFFMFWGAFGELLGGPWAYLGTLWAPKWRPGAMLSLGESSFFFALVIFATQIQIFTNLGRFGKGFGKVLGVFGDGFWRLWLRFWGSLGKRITCVWEWLIACICKQSRCKMSTNRYKLQWAIPLEALVASLKAVLFSILWAFWSLGDTMFFVLDFCYNWGV